MKYKKGETVMLLDTEFKPFGSAIVLDLNTDSKQYEVEFQFPKSKLRERIWVPQERLIVASEIKP
jgi:hypothetical protein